MPEGFIDLSLRPPRTGSGREDSELPELEDDERLADQTIMEALAEEEGEDQAAILASIQAENRQKQGSGTTQG